MYQQGLEKEEQLEKRRDNIRLPPVQLPYNLNKSTMDELDHRMVYVSGELLHERELRVLPRYFEETLGCLIITPLRRTDGSIVMINRGWVPAQLKTPELRTEAQVTGKVTILGHVVPGDNDFSFKLGSNKPFFQVVNTPERNVWPRIDLEEMGNWVNSQPVLISALANPPNPGGYPIGGQTEFKLDNWLLTQSYQMLGSAAIMMAVLTGSRFLHRFSSRKRFPWQPKPPTSTPFTD